jgi:NADH:ubiquinone oxidoreductase subunit 6 (subunit J)
MDLPTFLFWTIAGLTGLCAIAVVVTQNIVRSALWLLFTLGGTAGIFFLIGADFVGATQLIVYVGGILVLVIFGVMLTAQGPFVTMKTGAAEWAVAMVVGILLFSTLAVTCLRDFKAQSTQWAVTQNAWADDEAHKPPSSMSSLVLGEAFLGLKEATKKSSLTGMPQGSSDRTRVAYLLPFEIISVHLLVVLIGAAYLARAKRRRGAVS